MCTPERLAGFALAIVLGAAACGAAAQGAPAAPGLGKALSAEEAAQWDLTIFPDGVGLPAGAGTAVEGRAIYDKRCAGCHGPEGRGASAEDLVGRSSPLDSPSPDKTVGAYWPFATTVFDFTRRAMPMEAPGSLTADEVYAVTAYLLHANGIIGERDEMNARSLPRVTMPNRNGFIWIDAKPAGAR